MTKEKKQLNVRVIPEIHEIVRDVCVQLHWTRDDVAEVAYASLFGSRDKLIEAKRAMLKTAYRRAGVKLPFNYPHNALAA